VIPDPLACPISSLRGWGIGFVKSPLNNTVVKKLKRKLTFLLEDLHGMADQLDQVLVPQISTWAELMYILSILFSREERQTIRKATIMTWKL
jgi:hypothetical protein